MSSAFNTYSLLKIDLDAVVSNYHFLRSQVGPASCAAVLKTNAYGCGSEAVAPHFYNAGCRHFFTAYTDEAIILKNALTPYQQKTFIYVLNGPYVKGWEPFYHQQGLITILNTLRDIEEWHNYAKSINSKLPAVLHVDTGMNRHGLPIDEYQIFLRKEWDFIDWQLIMSHLACSHDKHHITNSIQLTRMQAVQRNHPKIPLSLANSGGIFLGSPYHFNLARPGIALYGLTPTLEKENSLTQAIELQSRIIQIQDIKAGQSVGYSETFKAESLLRLATLAIGYADGVPWRLGNQGAYVFIQGIKAPIVGRISMDLITVDITHLPQVQIGEWASLLNKETSLDDWTSLTGTINH